MLTAISLTQGAGEAIPVCTNKEQPDAVYGFVTSSDYHGLGFQARSLIEAPLFGDVWMQ